MPQTRQHRTHPASLGIFFATEMWERYGFYVIQSLLALYLALHFQWPDHEIYQLVGSFTALSYLCPLIGGWTADRLLGQKGAILTGAVILLISYIALVFMDSDNQLSACLAGIAVGTGLLKPNISSLLGNEYPEKSPHRESGFLIFYMGLTTGIILGTTLPGYLSHHFGWSVAFFSAAIGMIFAISVFTYGIYRYKITNYHNHPYTFKNNCNALALMILQWWAAFYMLNNPALADTVFAAVIVLTFTWLFWCVKDESQTQARQTMVIIALCMISILFWAFYFQMFMSLTLFILRVVQPVLFGIHFPPPAYVAIQSLGMIVFGLFLARRKRHRNHMQHAVFALNHFLMAMLLMTGAYALIVLVCKLSPPLVLLSPLVIIPAYLLISWAELFLSPVGLSVISYLAGRKKVSSMVGVFFVSIGIGGFISGKLASLTAISYDDLPVGNLKLLYTMGFTSLLYCLIAATLISLILNYTVKKYVIRG